ncbi:MAG TPA: type VI secretion system accessory protein TagJ, partial [Methylibium sp.]
EALRKQAMEQAEPSPGRVDGEAVQWICDADSRLGPVLEAFVNGRYCWLPFGAIARLQIEAPQDLRDLVWASAHLEFPNGGEAVALIPARYPGCGPDNDERLLMSRLTEWEVLSGEPGEPGEHYAGRGQRILATDLGETGLLELRSIELTAQAGQHEADAA